MEYLFEIDISGKVYADLWLLGMAMLAPVYLLVNIPEQFDYPRSECQFPKGVYFILSYILVPLALLYMVILYAYMIKILFQWELPQGQLGTMISVFGAIGVFTHAAIHPIQNQGYALLGWFYRYFYLAMLVPLGLLSLAIGERISQYGVTDLRYIVAMIAIWFAILIISQIFKRQQFRLQHITLSLALLIFLSSFGPWGIQQLPVNDQFSRLKSVLVKENILVNGQLNVIQQPDVLVRKSIISMMTYLLENNAATKFRPWFENKQSFDAVLKCEVTNSCRRSDAKQLVSLMKLDYVDSWADESNRPLIEISRSNINIINHTESMFSVSGYDFFIPVYHLLYVKDYSIRLQNNFTKEYSEFNLKLDKQGLLSLSTTGGDSISFDLIKLAAQFPTSNTSQIVVIKDDKLVLKQSNQQLAGTLYVDQLKLRKNKIEQLSGRLLIKLVD